MENKYTNEFFEEFEAKYMGAHKKRETSGATEAKGARHARKKKSSPLIKALCVILAVVVLAVVLIEVVTNKIYADKLKQAEEAQQQIETQETVKEPDYNFYEDENTIEWTDEIYSEYGILVDLETRKVIAEKNSEEIMYPASMTKVLTLLVAMEHIQDINDTFVMTADIINPVYKRGASMAGFKAGESVRIKDMLYGIALPSGAEAAVGIAVYVSGSEEKFVELMNEKVAELGITTAHFCNTSGLHDDDHYCTVKDMAIILNEALNNDICFEVLSAWYYTTEPTDKNPEGISLINSIAKRIKGDEPGTATIVAGKTGYTNEAGNCLASFGVSETGKEYIFVSAKANGGECFEDHINVYRDYTEHYEYEEEENSEAEN